MNPKPARKRTRRGRPTPHSDTTPTAFVIMPFEPESEFKAVFEGLFKPPLEAARFRVERADTSLDQENILKSIVRGISGSEVVLADLTTRNPNVLYELGMAHGLNKPTILVAQSIEDIPFDLRPYRVNVYPLDFREVEGFKQWLRDLGEKLLASEILFGNPVSDFLPPMAPAPAREAPKAEPRPEGAELAPAEEEAAEAGFLDWMADADAAGQESVASLLKISQAMQHMANRIRTKTQQMEKTHGAARPGAAKQLRTIVTATAHDILGFVKIADAELPRYRASWERFAESTLCLLRSPFSRDPQRRDTVSKLRNSVAGTLKSVAEATAGLDGLQASTRSARDISISRDFNFATDRILRTIAAIRVELETSRASCIKILGLLDEILEESPS